MSERVLCRCGRRFSKEFLQGESQIRECQGHDHRCFVTQVVPGALFGSEPLEHELDEVGLLRVHPLHLPAEELRSCRDDEEPGPKKLGVQRFIQKSGCHDPYEIMDDVVAALRNEPLAVESIEGRRRVIPRP